MLEGAKQNIMTSSAEKVPKRLRCRGRLFLVMLLWTVLFPAPFSAFTFSFTSVRESRGCYHHKSFFIDAPKRSHNIHKNYGVFQKSECAVSVSIPRHSELQTIRLQRQVQSKNCLTLNVQTNSDDESIIENLDKDPATSEDNASSAINSNQDTSFMSSMGDMEGAPDHHSLAPKDVSPYKSKTTDSPTSKPGRGWKFWNAKGEAQDELTFSQRLRKMGLSVLLSYGFVSNMSYCITVSLAWYIFNKQTGLSPLTKGQWPKFLAVYAGFYVFNNIIRPARLTLAVVVGRYFDSAVLFLQNKCKCKKWVAIALLVFLANIVGTCSFMALGICLASTLSGVPIRAVAPN